MATTPSSGGEWKKRSVVSSFLMKIDDEQRPRIALFQRSDEVSTYQHHLAPISGTIDPALDPSPVSAAWREIKEETTLTPTSLVLLRQGKPYSFKDPSIRREWTVHPFLFQLKNPATDEQKIQIDWEHEDWTWHDPDAIIREADGDGNYPGSVPRLAQSLRRVWFETDLGPAGAGKVLSVGLEALARDHESGARQMAGAALQTLRGVLAEMNGPGENGLAEEWWEKVRFAAWHLWKNGRESMGAAIMSALLAALAGIEQVMMQKSSEPGPLRGAVLRELDERIAARQEAAKRISQAFTAYLETSFPSKRAAHEPISILTLSESSTIRQGLRDAALEAGFVLDLRVLESRPLYEGLSLAASLAEDLSSTTSSGPSSAEAEHTIIIYSDASAALAASDIDVVLLGADRISASGDVSNKTGSLPAVLSAKHVCPGAKVFVLGESDKIAPPGRREDHIVEDNDPSQISRAWQAEYNSGRVRGAAAAIRNSSSRDGRVKIEIRNIFFEWVPAGLVDAYVTQSGLWTVQQIAQHSEKLQAEQERFFGSL
ncbi:uncharacterized protein B0T15DRAFT_286124 [Chaetomium strumarium]|uniref:Nudix hydrolase domain-containing protein n=1 Tax=Chaetomium strumarium TaxID=1170767 RepID=A0AAJ0GQ55_9PEZI|nr:hypothetical protein B0T15DRAFT_286124 [Chaetomium strumarium]